MVNLIIAESDCLFFLFTINRFKKYDSFFVINDQLEETDPLKNSKVTRKFKELMDCIDIAIRMEKQLKNLEEKTSIKKIKWKEIYFMEKPLSQQEGMLTFVSRLVPRILKLHLVLYSKIDEYRSRKLNLNETKIEENEFINLLQINSSWKNLFPGVSKITDLISFKSVSETVELRKQQSMKFKELYLNMSNSQKIIKFHILSVQFGNLNF